VRSRYLHLIPVGDDVVAFSALTGGMLRVPLEIAQCLSSGSPESIDAVAREHAELLGIGAAIDENVDERDLVRVRVGRARFAELAPNVTVVPTLACNFRCSYCDQQTEWRSWTMDDETARATVEYLGERLEGVEQFSVTWYGGEPLLALDRLTAMQEAILSLCAERGIGLLASVVTNGWLLDVETTSRLIDAGIRLVQVCLDGPPEVHDARRATRDGRHTFERVLGNVLAARESLEVRLRINVDADNMSSLPRLFDLLAEHALVDNAYLAPIVCYEPSCAGIGTPFLDGTRFGAVLDSLVDRLPTDFVERRLTPIPLPCTAPREATYVFDPGGNVFRCWQELGHPDLAVDHVTHGGGNAARRLFWLNYDPLAHPECAECDVLPLCLGGCPEQRRRGVDPPMCCSPLRSHLHGFVRSSALRSANANATDLHDA
jgi:uncharacterized protein